MQHPSDSRQTASNQPRLAWLLGKTSLQRWLTISVVVAFSVFIALYLVISNQPMLDRRIVSEAGFPVYAPGKLPEGYAIDRGATKLSGSTLSYVLETTSSGRQITVTVQPTPSDFEAGQLVDKDSIKSTVVSSGTLYNLSAGSTTQYLLDTGDTLVFITSSERVDTATVNALANSLVKQN